MSPWLTLHLLNRERETLCFQQRKFKPSFKPLRPMIFFLARKTLVRRVSSRGSEVIAPLRRCFKNVRDKSREMKVCYNNIGWIENGLRMTCLIRAKISESKIFMLITQEPNLRGQRRISHLYFFHINAQTRCTPMCWHVRASLNGTEIEDQARYHDIDDRKPETECAFDKRRRCNDPGDHVKQ
jgi:hypothetical protein